MKLITNQELKNNPSMDSVRDSISVSVISFLKMECK